MKDFEVHPIGHFNEIRLSRNLMNEISDYQDYDALHPRVLEAVKKLESLYKQQIEEGTQ